MTEPNVIVLLDGQIRLIVGIPDDDIYEVEWGDGRREVVRAGKNYSPHVFGSPRYLRQWDKTQLRRLFEQRPLDVFLMTMDLADKPLKAAELQEAVVNYGFSIDEVSAAWSAVEPSIASAPSVKVSASRVPTYRLVDAHLDYPPVPTTSSVNPDAEADLPSVSIDGQIRLVDTAETVLTEAIRLSALPRKSVLAVVTSTSAESMPFRFPVFSLLTLPEHIERNDEFRSWLASPGATINLKSVLDERDSSDEQTRSLSIGLLLVFGGRLASSDRLAPDALPQLIRLLAALSSDPASVAIRTPLAGKIAMILRSEPTSTIPRSQFDELARGLRDLPFENQGGRSALLNVIAKAGDEIIAERAWWVGFTFEVAATMGDGALGDVLRNPRVSENLLRPLVAGQLRKIDSRRSLARIFAASSPVAELITPEMVEVAVRKAAMSDRNVRGWLRQIAGSDEIELAQNSVRELESDLRAAVERTGALSAQLAASISDRERLLEQLRSAEKSSSGLLGRERRQLLIDSARATAQLAILIETEVPRLSPKVVIERVRAFARRHDLIAIGAVGSRTVFDPAKHAPADDQPAIGADVIVVRTGYEWIINDEAVVLQKAQVSEIDELDND